MKEIWNAYDKDFNIISGVKLVRGEKIPDGMFHLVCEVIVKHLDGTYLLMKRDKRKHLGLMWEASAGGSAIFGETPIDCARRELKEETGISAINIYEIGRVIEIDKKSIYVEYLCLTNNKTNITLQDGETISYKWVDRTALEQVSALASRRILQFVDKPIKIRCVWEHNSED